MKCFFCHQDTKTVYVVEVNNEKVDFCEECYFRECPNNEYKREKQEKEQKKFESKTFINTESVDTMTLKMIDEKSEKEIEITKLPNDKTDLNQLTYSEALEYENGLRNELIALLKDENNHQERIDYINKTLEYIQQVKEFMQIIESNPEAKAELLRRLNEKNQDAEREKNDNKSLL